MPKPPAKPFDWMEPRRNPNRQPIEAAGRAAMYRAEIEERAALLGRLGHGRDQTRLRLLANFARTCAGAFASGVFASSRRSSLLRA